jgi:hypothetical protein
LTFAISGFFAELIGSTFLSPFEAARIRLVTTPTFASGVVDCMSRIIKEEKIESLFRGLPAVFAKQIPFTVVQLASFELITTSIYSYLSRSDNNFDFNEVSKYKYAISGVSAIVAAVLSSLASQPGDTLLSAVNKGSRNKKVAINSSVGQEGAERSVREYLDSASDYDTVIEAQKVAIQDTVVVAYEAENPLTIMKETFDEIGVKGLFRGTKARLFHVSFYVVVQFLAYDTIKQLVGLPVTGVH